MNNEEKNIPTVEEPAEEKILSPEPAPEAKKKLSKGAIIGIAAGAAAVIVAVIILLVTLLGGEKPHTHSYVDGKCECGVTDPDYVPPHEHSYTDGKCECGEIFTITIAEAMELCKEYPNGTPEKYYIRATVKNILNVSYGEMYIEDSTGELYIYGTRGADGTTYFDKLEETPSKGDEVLLLCLLSQYNGENQVKLASLIDFEHKEVNVDLTAYEEMTIAEARDASEGDLVKVKGVVARITYANGKKPSGVILVDETSSIYVYDAELAGKAAIGNTVEVAATKTYWILDSEKGNANKFGYKGANQLDNVTVITNDKGNTAFDKSWVTESTVKEIIDTPVSEDITNKIFKVNALVKKAPGNGFVNYYIDDIDGVTGSYVYTQCNGGDFEWLDQFDGKICTVYIVAINAKSTATGCNFRFLPVEVIDEGYEFDTEGAAEYAVKYHGVGQFLNKYTGDPVLELTTSVSSELLGFENATLSYSSSNEASVYFSTEGGKTVMHCGETGSATVTVTGSYGGKTYSESIEITVASIADVEYITVKEAITTPVETTITVRGIVGPSVVNKNGFYFFGEDGSVITVVVNNTDLFDEIEIGHDIIITGLRERYIKDDSYTTYGQEAIVNAELVANFYGSHEYSNAKFITDKTLADIAALDATESHSTEVYLLTVTVKVVEAQYYSNIYVVDGNTELLLYCSSSNQYSWLKAYNGQTITVEIAPCNWNDKTNYRGCVLAVVNEDGTKVLNTLNFN